MTQPLWQINFFSALLYMVCHQLSVTSFIKQQEMLGQIMNTGYSWETVIYASTMIRIVFSY